jgi:PadR family transcriptional regulator, regulatory protein PadR
LIPNPWEEVRGGLPRAFIRSCLLLLIAERPSYGYDLLEGLAELGMSDVDPGGLYRTLRSMEKDGLVASRWDTSDVGPKRRVYSLTDEGMDWLHAWAGAHAETARILGSFVSRYEGAITEADAVDRLVNDD